jgi:dihydroorotate dehydrogenase
VSEPRIEPASLLHALARPLLFTLDSERAHDLALDVLERVSSLRSACALVAACHAHEDARLATHAFGLRFANPLGVAAGLDKDARAVRALAALGFGHVEIGTVTPRPQPGNPRPRVFRLPEDGALVNRLGFPSQGATAVAERLAELGERSAVVGVNLGKNKETENERAVDDYLVALEALRAQGDYFVVNVSSPNTPGLRQLQSPAALTALVSSVARAAAGKSVLVKLAPDLDDAQLLASLDAAGAGGAAGIILANTTLARPASLRHAAVAREAGGLSGSPLRGRSVQLMTLARRHVGARLALVGVGGVSTAEDAWRLLRAGASLVQAYTGFVYAGPAMAREILRGLSRRLDESGARSIAEIVGVTG